MVLARARVVIDIPRRGGRGEGPPSLDTEFELELELELEERGEESSTSREPRSGVVCVVVSGSRYGFSWVSAFGIAIQS